MTGQNLIVTFVNCQFSMLYQEKPGPTNLGTNIYIDAQDTNLDNNSVISFKNCAIGGSAIGVRNGCEILNADNISFANCWFEDTDFGLSIYNSRNIIISETKFANAAGCGSRPFSSVEHYGSCIRVENSSVKIESNFATVSDPDVDFVKRELFIQGVGTNNTINACNNNFHNLVLSETFGIAQYQSVKFVSTLYNPGHPVKLGIETGGKKFVLITVDEATNHKDIFRINSTILTGEMLYIRAENHDLVIHAWDAINESQGRNVFLSGLLSITLLHGQGALFIKTDGLNGSYEKCAYQLVSRT